MKKEMLRDRQSDEIAELKKERDELREALAKFKQLQSVIDGFGKVVCALRGVEPVDAADGSQNWWMFAEDGEKLAVKVINEFTARGAEAARWKREASALRVASDKVGSWLSAALDDDVVCAEMKADINAWFSALAMKPIDGEVTPSNDYGDPKQWTQPE